MIAYAITDPSTLNFETLVTDIKRFASKSDMIVYRDKATENYALNAKQFMLEAQKHMNVNTFLHTDYKLAKKLHADGVHLQSTQLNDIVKAKALNLLVVVSTHSLEDALEAQYLGADMLTFSPIFDTPNKGKPQGLKALTHMVSLISIPVIALGGIISEKHISLCEEHGAEGFASIRYFS
ncbi:MAG: Thiamine monophosphate synthase [uncultured Sulfurovum sp.]|uniref:Thiamine monophosphate synthase n=1 Tax=uncultured Sulfurovum sp. TaxID=269237 RepID=A0A6S6T2N4_9BACT|nr:MAG: Thiamine monophosphate synthase [uncultured Sulfurovum sp.]